MSVTNPTPQSIVILISGGGSNMRAIVEAASRRAWLARFGAEVTGVVSNQANAAGLAWAASQGIATRSLSHHGFASREAFDQALIADIEALNGGQRPALVVLAGFMRILTPGFVGHFENRLLNIHPSLLPAFPGLHTHQRALAIGCQFVGATVHRVTPVLDEGELLAQAVVPVLPGDDADQLAARVLTQEHRIYPRAIEALLAQGVQT
jgi:phosphoribosylglycinamide formyltransferase 1